MTYYTELQRLCDAQTAQLAAQQDEIGMLRAILAGRTQERDEARVTTKSLADAVLTFGIHHPECPRYEQAAAVPCTCGFSAAIDAAYAVAVQL